MWGLVMNSHTPLQVAAVAVDLDGTLIDTESEICLAVNATLAHCGRTALSAANIVSLTGQGTRKLIESALNVSLPLPAGPAAIAIGAAQHVDQAVDLFKSVYKRVLGTQARLYPGVLDGLDLLKKKALPTACVTNKGAQDADYLLEQLGIRHFFDHLIAPATMSERKPSPYLLRKACQLLNVSPENLVLIGDSNNDVMAARAAGVSVIRLDTGYERHALFKQRADLNYAGFLQAAQAVEARPHIG